MLSDDEKTIVMEIINDRAHGIEFYTKEMAIESFEKLDKIIKSIGLNKNLPDSEKIDKVNNYLKANVAVRNDYFCAFREEIPEIPSSELIYRTAYAALVKGEAMCAGFTESARMLLELNGLETKTLLSMLPGKNKHLLHYVTAIKYDCGSGRDYYIMDPERERSCEEKGFDFRRYLLEMTFIKPNDFFYENKVGINGVGPRAKDFIENCKPDYVFSKNKVDELFEKDEKNG